VGDLSPGDWRGTWAEREQGGKASSKACH
jgi:hypothetical protein